jgi:hypothetical protein
MRTRETRETAEGFVVTRYRVCPEGHAYATYEIDNDLRKTLAKHAQRPERVRGIQRRTELYWRNKRIVERAKQVKHVVVALEFGLSDNMISHIVRQWRERYGA